MDRILACFLVLGFGSLLIAADPTPVEKQLGIQKAMLAARQHLEASRPAEAVAALEVELAKADGNKAFLSLLREAYQAELDRLEKSAPAEAARIAQVRRHLALLAESPRPAVPPPSFDPPADSANPIAQASAEFRKGNYAAAGRLFAAGADKLSEEQKAAWAYCRIWAANEQVIGTNCDASKATALAAEVGEALKLAPANAELQKHGQKVIAAASRKGAARDAGDSFAAIETASFRIRYSGSRDLADSISRSAEAIRKETFERWSGPPAGPWSVKCEIYIHPTADAFARATGRPAASTGHAVVRLVNGNAEERRIDLRADDVAIATNALPRELTHVVLADLFPDKPAPKWAVEGMAILAGSPDESERYLRTLRRCARDGEWLPLAQLLEMKEFPADKVTAFYCQSVALTEYLIRASGSERNFTIFLRDCQRYGSAQALRRQFGIDSVQSLESTWKRATLESSR